MTETTLRVFQVWLNVINALLLRDIRARAGTFYSGYLLVFLMPFLHLAAVLIVFIATGRVPPVGTQPIIFYGLSILPFVVFVYPSRQIVVALAANRPLLYFPQGTYYRRHHRARSVRDGKRHGRFLPLASSPLVIPLGSSAQYYCRSISDFRGVF